MLQWGSIEGEVRRPDLPPGVVTPQGSWTPAGEDADAGPSIEVTHLMSHSGTAQAKLQACCRFLGTLRR